MTSIKTPSINRVITRRNFKRKPQSKSLSTKPKDLAVIELKRMFNLENKERRYLGVEEVSYSEWRSQGYKEAFIKDFVSNYSAKKHLKLNSKYNNQKQV